MNTEAPSKVNGERAQATSNRVCFSMFDEIEMKAAESLSAR